MFVFRRFEFRLAEITGILQLANMINGVFQSFNKFIEVFFVQENFVLFVAGLTAI